MAKDISRSNIRNYRPRQEAANLLLVLEQIAAWRSTEMFSPYMGEDVTSIIRHGRAKHGEQAQTTGDDRADATTAAREPSPRS